LLAFIVFPNIFARLLGPATCHLELSSSVESIITPIIIIAKKSLYASEIGGVGIC
jgi:hypothetical protein